MRGRYGHFHKHLELFDLYEDFRDDPEILEALNEADDDGYLLEGSGAPEGRVSFPFFLQTMIRTKLRAQFTTAASVWDQYVGIENAQDFRQHTVHSLGPIRGIEGIPEFGEYPRLRSSEEGGPSYMVGKYGGIYAITYELIINDDTGEMLNRIPAALGQSMSDYLNQAVVAFIESNPTYIDGQPFFGEAHKNEVTGADAEPTEDNLAALLDMLRLRRNAEGFPLNIKPRRLLVRNPSTKLLFDKIIRSQTTGIRADAKDMAEAGTRFAPGTDNPLANAIPADATIEDPYLNDPNDWYLLADADARPAFVAAFLRNQRVPYIFQKNDGVSAVGAGAGGDDPYMFNIDEIPFKIRHIWGVSAGEPFAAIRARPS
ncbi:MAG: hypothetical protein ACRDPE_15200 [Solirubrobacterales bacterium]